MKLGEVRILYRSGGWKQIQRDVAPPKGRFRIPFFTIQLCTGIRPGHLAFYFLKSEKLPKPIVVSSKHLASSWKINFYEDTLKYSKGKKFKYARFTSPSFALAVASRSDGKLALVRQYRPGVRNFFWEFPAGMVEENEEPVGAIKREFQEEVGYELDSPRLLAVSFVSPSRSNQRSFLFYGKVGRKAKKHLDGNEKLQLKFASREEAMNLILRRISAVNLLALLASGEKI